MHAAKPKSACLSEINTALSAWSAHRLLKLDNTMCAITSNEMLSESGDLTPIRVIQVELHISGRVCSSEPSMQRPGFPSVLCCGEPSLAQPLVLGW